MEVKMNETIETNQELLEFFKALADANRLKIIGLLAQSPCTVEQIASGLNLHSSTVSHHLARLAKTGLVSARPDSYYSVYQLETKQLEAMAQRILSQETLPVVAEQVDMEAYDRKVLNTYLTQDGRVRDFPTQQKKLEVILRHVVQVFEPGQRYTERQVNEMLSRFNEDTARLRRNLVDFKLMQRQGGGGEYWRTIS
jgi:DNA-binding HxlR family transcriptional regulator